MLPAASLQGCIWNPRAPAALFATLLSGLRAVPRRQARQPPRSRWRPAPSAGSPAVSSCLRPSLSFSSPSQCRRALYQTAPRTGRWRNTIVVSAKAGTQRYGGTNRRSRGGGIPAPGTVPHSPFSVAERRQHNRHSGGSRNLGGWDSGPPPLNSQRWATRATQSSFRRKPESRWRWDSGPTPLTSQRRVTRATQSSFPRKREPRGAVELIVVPAEAGTQRCGRAGFPSQSAQHPHFTPLSVRALSPCVAYPSRFHQSNPPISSLTWNPRVSSFNAVFVEALHPMPSQ